MIIIPITAFALVLSTFVPGPPPQNPRDPVANFEYAWSRLDRNCAQFGAKHIDWDAVHRVYRARVTPATTDEELWSILLAMVGTLNDAHVCLQDGKRRECGGLTEGLKSEGFSRDLVKSKYLQGKAVELVKGKVTYGWLTPDIGYVHIFDFKGTADPLYAAIDSVIAEFAKARALVVDVRDNPGGTGVTADRLARRFVDRKRHYSTTRTRYGAHHDALGLIEYNNVEPGGPLQFTGPTVLLTNRGTGSAAEGFALALRVLPHVTVVGDVTEGALSSQFPDRLPNGWTLWVSFHMVTDQDGVNWDGVGIPPDLRVVNTAADVAAGVDRPLEFAQQFLEKGAPAAQDESGSLVNLKTSLVETYLATVKAKGVQAAVSELTRLRAKPRGDYVLAPDEALRQAGPLLARKQYAEAIGLLQACQQEWPQMAATYAMLARAHLGKGDLAAAEAIMKKGETVEPMFPFEVPQIEQANMAIRKQKFGSAAAVLEKALAEGGVAAAEKVFPDLLARREGAGPVLDENDFNNLGYKLLKQTNLESAIYVFEKNAVLFPTSANVYDSLGEALAIAGRREQAIESYRKAIALDPTNAGARAKLSELEKRDSSLQPPEAMDPSMQ
jgi:tetratricopeptide (TPR) repeat protein